ncbi:terminase large subunit domain-containing protein [Vreelandella populi]|uniref:terminase large subunit domain-containing protein n=1 Tax=Vreelandella populi TaxID=2498858 RepID=UPI000F8C804F|nr:terminase family protein [Halomonas populi]RUR52706.1 hypothetical protein ELY40_11690 [Halomonas populi]
MNPALTRQYKRWYELKDIPEQVRLITEQVRFKVVPAGRRSGKTERAKRFLAKQAMRHEGETYFAAAPTRDQVKKIWWDDLKALTFSAAHAKAPSESELKIYMPNGTEIHLIGLDKPERIEGIAWTGGVIDEIADVKAHAWEAHILPALNTVSPERPDYRAWCWLIGVPDGLNHYYDLYQYALNSGDPEWAAYHWKSAEILPEDVINSAKRVMSPKQFKQEFEAGFETATGRIYEDYGAANATDETIQPHEQLLWMHDQNFTPLSSAIGVIREDCLYLLDEIVLESAISRQSAEEFVERYKDHKNKHVLVYGDPAGRAGEKHGHASDYTDIEDVLRQNGWRFTRKVKPKAPAIKDRQNAVRARICNAAGERRLFVNPTKAVYCHKGLATVQLQKGSTFQEDQTNQYQHITTAIGYMVDATWPIGLPKTGTTIVPGFR